MKTNKLLSAVMIVALVLATATTAESPRVPTVKPGPDAAQVSGMPGVEARDLFGVTFTAINGRNISPRSDLWLEPGRHVLTLKIPARYTAARLFTPNIRDIYVDIELELEPGKTYHVRGQYNRNDRDNPYDVIIDRIS